jgi:carbon monoxide dehydrogenase subunit G
MKHQARLFVVVAAVAAVASLSGCDAISGYFRAKSAAVKWEGPIEEIASADLKKDGKVFTIKLESRIDAPPDKVWAAMKQPEKLAQNSEQYKKSDILKDEGNHKELEIHVMALDNLQQLTVSMDFDDANKTLHLKTMTSTIADIDGTYTVTPSPDGTKSLYTYTAKQTDKVALPISEDVQRSAIKESFVNQVRAIKKQIAAS